MAVTHDPGHLDVWDHAVGGYPGDLAASATPDVK